MDFCTLGMYITDDIYPAKTAADQTPQLNIVGGAGTYSAVGARLLSPPPSSKSVGWIVDAGTDFPNDLRSLLLSWDTGLLIRQRDGLTTKGWNGYGENDHRSFKYLTEKKRLNADDLEGDLLLAKSFHLICSAARCIDLVTSILAKRKARSTSFQAPLFIWEPVPDLCTSAELEAVKEVLKHVDIVSPNHDELGSLFNFRHGSTIDKSALQKHAETLLESGRANVIVRAGKEGCFVADRQSGKWIPAYHTSSENVKDPTGGGNGFLGGFAVGLVRTRDLKEAAIWGSIAASFCIEQVGVPVLDRQTDGVEKWNGCDVSERLSEYRKRLL